MFDSRNKSQPKLVYAHAYVSPTDLQNEQAKPANNVTETKEVVKEHSQLQPGSKNTTMQRNPDPQSLQHQKEQRQQPEMQRSTPQQPKQISGDLMVNRKEPSVTDSFVQNESQMKTPKQPLNNSSNDTFKRTPQTMTLNYNQNENNVKREQFEEFSLYRGREFEGNREKLLINESIQRASSSKTSSLEGERKVTVPPPSPSRHGSVSKSSNSDSSDVNFLRHPRTNGVNSPVQRNRPQTHPPPPHQHTHRQQLLYQQQQNQLKQMHMQQQIRRDHSHQNEEGRLHGQVIRVRSYPAGRQQMTSSSHPNSHKPGNSGQSWNIPRVSPSVSVRPHSLTLPPSQPQDGLSGSQHTQKDFSNYNPSASPRALRSHVRLDSDSSSRQASASNASTLSSASNPPKSILKNNLSLEQSDLYLASRPLVLPRAHSEKNANYVARDFDFSSILTTNKDPLSAKPTSIQVTGQVLGQATASANPPQSQRPVTAGSAPANFEMNPNGRPIRKSVTFNSLVRLHQED